MANKILQILRNSAGTTAADLAAAKTALNSQIASRHDGELIACRYMDGTEVKAIIGIVNKANGAGQNIDSLTFFEGLNVNADPNSLPASVQAALNALVLTEVGGSGQYVKSVKQENGKVSAVAEELTAGVVKATAITAVEGSKVAVTGETVAAQIDSLAQTIAAKDAAQSNAIKDLDVTAVGGAGKYIKSVGQTNGVIEPEAADLNASAVTATGFAKDAKGNNVAVTGDNVAEQIESIAKTIGALDASVAAEDFKYIKSISQADGLVSAEKGELKAANVAASEITGDASKVAVEGTTVAAQIEDLATTLKTVENNAAKYKVVKLTAEEIATLSDASNVKEAYKVVSYVGDFDTAEKTQVGDTIKIYKDASLESVTSTGDDNTVVTFVYTLANGERQTVTVDLGKAIFESEMGNGIQVVDSKIGIKMDGESETFLSVGEKGLKLSGVQTAINNKVAGLDADITSAADGHKVKVQVVEVDGMVNAVNVTETDIASAQGLADEITRATKAEAAAKTVVSGETNFIDVTPSVKNAEGEDGHTEYAVSVAESAKTRLGHADNALQTVSADSANENLVSVTVSNKSGNNGAKTQAITLTPKVAEIDVESESRDRASVNVTTNGLIDADTLKKAIDDIEVIDGGTF